MRLRRLSTRRKMRRADGPVDLARPQEYQPTEQRQAAERPTIKQPVVPPSAANTTISPTIPAWLPRGQDIQEPR